MSAAKNLVSSVISEPTNVISDPCFTDSQILRFSDECTHRSNDLAVKPNELEPNWRKQSNTVEAKQLLWQNSTKSDFNTPDISDTCDKHSGYRTDSDDSIKTEKTLTDKKTQVKSQIERATRHLNTVSELSSYNALYFSPNTPNTFSTNYDGDIEPESDNSFTICQSCPLSQLGVKNYSSDSFLENHIGGSTTLSSVTLIDQVIFLIGF